MVKVINKKTKVVKELKKEFEASMYIGTGEWEIFDEKEKKQEEKVQKTPIINTSSKEEK